MGLSIVRSLDRDSCIRRLDGRTVLTFRCKDRDGLGQTLALLFSLCWSCGTALDVSMCHDLDSFECSRYNNYDGGYEIDYDTKCPLESLKIYKYHRISDADFTVLEELYGDIIEYVE